MRTDTLLVVMCLISTLDSVGRGASLELLTNREEWSARVGGVARVGTTPAALAAAEELGASPDLDGDLGSTLTFSAEATGLPFGFQLTNLSIQPPLPRGLVYRDDERGLDEEGTISIGEADGLSDDPSTRDIYENDDFEIRLLDGSVTTSIGFYLVGNQDNREEALSLWLDDQELVRITEIPGAKLREAVFFGIVSDTPFNRLIFDDDINRADVDGDDIGIRDFYFASSVPEPVGCLPWLVGACGLWIAGRVRVAKNVPLHENS